MAKILGLDLGTNSIGWALIDDSQKEIIKTDVRIFPEGVNDINTSKEKSKNADRRIARGIRRNNYRFKMRRERLKRVLKEFGMTPDERYYTFQRRKDGERFYLTTELYELRKEALERALRLEDLGRIFLHLNNHRGFKSNKKEEADKEFKPNIKDADKINTLEQKQNSLLGLKLRKERLLKEIEELNTSQRKDAAKRIKTRNNKIREIEKKIKEVEEVKTLQEKIDEAKNKGEIKYGTLGEYFYHLIELNKNSHNPDEPIKKIRNNDAGEGEYTTREIFEFEFDMIWERQKELNKNNDSVLRLLSDKNKKRIKDECIFYQRDLRSQKHLVDKCKYEYTEYFVYRFDEGNLKRQIDAITFSDSKHSETFLNDEQKKNLFGFLSKKKEIGVADLKKLVEIKDDFEKGNGTYQNRTAIHHLPQEKILERDYLPCCHISSLEFQEFRIWDKVNNLRYIDRDNIEHSLTPEQKNILVDKLHNVVSLFIEIGNKASVEEKEEAAEIKEALGLTIEDKFKEQKLKGNVTLAKLKEALENDYWDSLNISATELEIEAVDSTTGEIVKLKSPVQYSDKQRQLYNNIVFAMNFVKSIDWLTGKGKADKWKESLTKLKEESRVNGHKLTDSQIEAYSTISLEPDYCNYSLKAIKKLLPWMKQGLNSSQAAERVGYGSASDERTNDAFLQDKLPDLKNNTLRNPIVQRGITETIKLVNDIIESELGGIKPDKIHLEMARELKKPKEVRQEAKRKNDNKEKEREQWKEFLKQRLGVEPSSSTLSKFELFLELEHQRTNFEEVKSQLSIKEFIEFCKDVMGEKDPISKEKFIELKKKLIKKGSEEESNNVEAETSAGEEKTKDKDKSDKNYLRLLKYRLYLECNRILPYTGQPISLTRLLKDNSDIEIEHIIPYSRCMDDSFLNKTLSDKAFNTLKGKQTPMEFFSSDMAEKKKFMSRINKIDNEEKKKRFRLEGDKALADFKSSQLVNTAYIGTEVKKHLLYAFKRDDIVMTNGQITAMVRGFLGFNKVLNPPMKFTGKYDKGLYWAFVNRDGRIEKLVPRSKQDEDEKPEAENKSWKVIKGFVYDGEDGKRFQPQKQRNDHRHHSVDAITIALSSNKIANIIQKNTEGYYLKDGKQIQKYEDRAIWVKKFDESGQLTTLARKKIIEEIKAELDFPNLWWQTKNAVEHVPISYSNKSRILSSARRKVHKNKSIFYSGGDVARGALHEESYYGNIKYPHKDNLDWYNKDNGVYVIRKALKYSKQGYFGKVEQLEKIVDPVIRGLIIKKAQKLGLKEALNEGIKLPNKKGKPVPVKKVRIATDAQELPWIRMHKQGTKDNKKKVWVEPGENQCIAIYGDEVRQGKEKREFITVSFLEAVKAQKENKPLFPNEYKGKKLLTYLSKKDMILIFKEHPDEIRHLIGKGVGEYSEDEKELLFKRLFYVMQSDKNGIIILGRHSLSGIKATKDKSVEDIDSKDGSVIRCNPNTFKGVKVQIDRLGNIKPTI
jgi:CRISPR/Cas system Type II protein with McrA/HNH and RuvC-like nuclease domain